MAKIIRNPDGTSTTQFVLEGPNTVLGQVNNEASGTADPIIDTYTPTVSEPDGGFYPTGGSDPTPIPNGDLPLQNINTLLDLYHSTFAPPAALPIGPAVAPAVTVVPATGGSDGSGSSPALVYLAVGGIVVTIGAHWYFNRKAA